MVRSKGAVVPSIDQAEAPQELLSRAANLAVHTLRAAAPLADQAEVAREL